MQGEAQIELLLEEKRLELLERKRAILYDGPDEDQQFLSVALLGETLGFWVEAPHEAIIRHQNRCWFGEHKACLTLAFRGMGKTVIGTVLRAVWCAVRDPDIRILFASDTEGFASSVLSEIRAHLTTNEDLQQMFGTFFPTDRRESSERGSYRQGYATIAQRQNSTLKEPTFMCLGIGGQAAGRHFDVIFGDDLVTIGNSRTPGQRKIVYDWHGSTLTGTRMPHTKSFYSGTRYYPNDQYETMEDGTPDQKHTGGTLRGYVLRIPALLDEGGPEERSSYPNRYSVADLKEMRRTMGRYHFGAQMQQDTKSGEGIIFSYGKFGWYGDGELPKKLAVFQFSDLAAKRTETGSYYATVTVGIEERAVRPRIFVLDLVREHFGMKDQRDSIVSLIKKWKPIQHGVEAVQMQAGFAQELQESGLLPVIPVLVEADKVFRARRVSPLVDDGRVFFPLPDSSRGSIVEPLIAELTTFPDGDYSDCTDAFVGAVTLAMYGGPEAASPVIEDQDEGLGLMADY
jgi:predicted phage terminase large subunit-like protein